MHSVRHFRSGGRVNARKVQKRTMDKKGKQQFLLVAFGVALYAALMNLNEVAAFLTRLATLFTPVIIGLLMAFVLSVPMQGIAGRLTRLMPKAKEKHIDLLSLLLTLLCVVIVVVLLCVLALPQLAASLKSIGTLVRENWPDWARLLSDHGVDTSELTDRIAALDWKTVLEKALTGAGAAQTYLVGESQLLHQPEFRDPDKAHRLMSYLSDGSNLLEIPMEQLGGENEVRVLIGPENVAEELRDSSVVLATYDAGENMRGLIGVVGPTRMDYSKVAAKLSFIAAGLSKLLGGGTLPPPGLDNKLIIKGDDSDEHENK